MPELNELKEMEMLAMGQGGDVVDTQAMNQSKEALSSRRERV